MKKKRGPSCREGSNGGYAKKVEDDKQRSWRIKAGKDSEPMNLEGS